MEHRRRRGSLPTEVVVAGYPPGDLQRTDFYVSGEHFVVLSYRASPEPVLLNLSRVESEVARAAAAGLANAEIAANRNCSVCTIQNQMANIYRKLGVSSRAALAAMLAGLEDHEV